MRKVANANLYGKSTFMNFDSHSTYGYDFDLSDPPNFSHV